MRKDQSDVLTNETHRGPLVIVYASQTGQAKSIAESLHDSALAHQYKPTLYDIAEHDKSFSFATISPAPLIFLCSTTGDGETPESARKAVSRLRRANKDTMDLSGLKYALLGLGDSNYSQFANGPKIFHKRLAELGASCFYGPRWADDGVGMELEVEPFKDGLWTALENLLKSPKDDESKQIDELESQVEKLALTDSSTLGTELTLPDLSECHMSIELKSPEKTDKEITDLVSRNQRIFSSVHTKSVLHRAKVIGNQQVTSPKASKQAFDLKFRCVDDNEAKIEYEPGHAVDVVVANSDREVNELIKRLGLEESKDKVISMKTLEASKKQGADFLRIADANPDLTLFELFKYCVDMRSNALKKAFVRMLAAHCSNEADQLRLLQLASREGSDDYTKLVKEAHLSLLDLLTVFKSCQPPLAHLVQMLPTLNTRAYSVCTRSNDPDIEVVFTMVDFPLENGRTYARNGVGTEFLSGLKPGDDLFFQKRKFNSFTFPSTTDEPSQPPLILIGPGTGIAPYVSYLRQLKHHSTGTDASSKSDHHLWLFYGCRRPDWDWLFRDEFLNELRPLLHKYSVSFSRLQQQQQPTIEIDTTKVDFVSECRYVQDLLRHHAAEIVRLVDVEKAAVYVCGDAKNMAKDVHACLLECLQTHLKLDVDQANKYLTEMIKSKRYKQDIWA